MLAKVTEMLNPIYHDDTSVGKPLQGASQGV